MVVSIGSTVGPYRLVELLGEGGMGAVYIGEHAVLRRTVAIKMLHGFLTKNVQVTQRFINEGVAASILESEHIVKVLDCQQDPRSGLWWIAMEHLQGQTLARFLASQNGPLPFDKVIKIACQIAEALDEAHAHGIIHRDIKPDNIFLTERGGKTDFVKVLDFGIAKLRREDAGVVTKTNTVLGTQPFMPPEQLRGWPVDHRVDVFALTVVVYLALSNGYHPFQQGETLEQFYQLTSAELCIRQLNRTPVDIRHWNPRIPESVARVLERGLHRDRQQRPNSAGDLVVELARAGGALEIVEQNSKLLEPNAARRSIQVPVQEAPIDTPPQERATVRALPNARPLPSTAPEPPPAAHPHTTLGSAASEAVARAPRSSSVRMIAIAFASLGVALVSAITVWFATKHAINDAPQSQVGTSPTSDAQVVSLGARGSGTPVQLRDASVVVSTADAVVTTGDPADASIAAVRVVPDATARNAAPTHADTWVRRPRIQAQSQELQRPGVLSVSAKPWADIEVDGKPRGTSPKDLVLAPGIHTVKLTGPSGAVKTQTVRIRSDQQTKITHQWTEP